MKIPETILISISLAMDAFAVAICKGLSMKKMNWKNAIIIGAYFGIFQMIMPWIGYKLGEGFRDMIESVDHWLAFGLLSLIGFNMIKESFEEKEKINEKVDFKTMIILAIATSIDALIVGITYAFLEIKNYQITFIIIGIMTFILSIIGVKIGNKFGVKFGKKAEMAGGVLLICIGIKILFEHIKII